MADKIQEQLIDELPKDYTGPESFWGETGLFSQPKKKIIECALDTEMDNHLGYTKTRPQRQELRQFPQRQRQKGEIECSFR
jgi:hypothetical protein